MARMRKLSQSKVKLKAIIYGDYGTRKSGFGADFALMKNEDGSPMKVLYIDAESESLSRFHINRLQNSGANIDNVLVVEPDSIDEVVSILKKVQNKEEFCYPDEDGDEGDEVILDSTGKPFFPDAIVLDSASALVQDIKGGIREVSKIRAKIRADKSDTTTSQEKFVNVSTAGIEMKDYDIIKGIGEKIVSNLIRKLDVHVCVIVRGKAEKKNIKTSSGFQLVDTGRQLLDAWDFLKFEGNIVIEMRKEIDEDGIVQRVYGLIDSKDRTGTFDQGQEIENPTITMWQNIINTNVGGSNYANRLSYEEKIDKAIANGVKDVEQKGLSVKELIISVKDMLGTAPAEKRKELGEKMRILGVTKEDVVTGNMDLETAKKVHAVFEEILEVK